MRKEIIGIIMLGCLLGEASVKGGGNMSREDDSRPVYRDKHPRLDPDSQEGIRYALMENKFAEVREKVHQLRAFPKVKVEGEFRPAKTLSLERFDIKVTLYSGRFGQFYSKYFTGPLSEEGEAASHRSPSEVHEVFEEVFAYFSQKVEARIKEPIPEVVHLLSLDIITPQEDSDKAFAYYFLQRRYPAFCHKWILVSCGQKLGDPGRIIAYGWEVSQSIPADEGTE